MSIRTHLRHVRRHWHLSQEELAELLDLTQGRVSQLEKGFDQPTLPIALALQVVFDRPPRALFPRIYSTIEERVITRAAALERRLSGRNDYSARQKSRLLTAMMHRATKSSSQ